MYETYIHFSPKGSVEKRVRYLSTGEATVQDMLAPICSTIPTSRAK